jgi:hypothetical protein
MMRTMMQFVVCSKDARFHGSAMVSGFVRRAFEEHLFKDVARQWLTLL